MTTLALPDSHVAKKHGVLYHFLFRDSDAHSAGNAELSAVQKSIPGASHLIAIMYTGSCTLSGLHPFKYC